MLRTLGRTLWPSLRRHAEQFRAQFEQSIQEITKDVGVDDIKADLRTLNELNPANQIRQTLDQAMRDVPSPNAYLRGEPAPGTAMTAFEEPQPAPSTTGACAVATGILASPSPSLKRTSAVAVSACEQRGAAAFRRPHRKQGLSKENKENLEPAAVL